jgi:predicted thioesterase
MEEARVLATPWMILWMERTSRQAVYPLLDEGYDTVGTEVHVKHLAATPIGMSVTFRSEVIAVNDRRLTFKVEAWNEKEKIGEGTHERVIIHVAKFAAKLLSKTNSQ